MGVYNYVKVPRIKCPECKKFIKAHSDWQSKEPNAAMDTVEYWETDEFHENCPHCNKYIEFRLSKKSRKRFTLNDYKGGLR